MQCSPVCSFAGVKTCVVALVQVKYLSLNFSTNKPLTAAETEIKVG